MAKYDITTANARLEFDTQQAYRHASCAIDATHAINFWMGVDNDGFAQVFNVNTSTWEVTTAGAVLEFDTVLGNWKDCIKVDDNHVFLIWYGGSGNDLMGQVFAINTSTWAVSTTQANATLDTAALDNPVNMVQVDANHFLAVWMGAANDGFTQVFAVNTSTWAVTTAGALKEWDTTDSYHGRPFVIDSNHFLVLWSTGASATHGAAQVLAVNTSTWAVTTAGALFQYYENSQYPDAIQIDANHFLSWSGNNSGVGYAHEFTINTTTWAVTTTVAAFRVDTAMWNPCANIVDSNHYLVMWQGVDNHGQAQIFTVNTTTYAVATTTAMFEFDTALGVNNAVTPIDQWHYINFWYGADVDGFTQVFTVDSGAPVGTTIEVPALTLTVTGNAPVVFRSRSIDIPVLTLTITGVEPTVKQSKYIDIPTLPLTISLDTLVVNNKVVINVPTLALTLTGIVPRVRVISPLDISKVFLMERLAPWVYYFDYRPLDTRYFKTDGTNGPVDGNLEVNGNLVIGETTLTEQNVIDLLALL